MEPIEINAGTWYLRALRADERITDVPALSALGIDQPATYVAAAEHDWHTETRFTWAVCIPTTGELVAVIGVDADRGLWGRCRDGHDEALTTRSARSHGSPTARSDSVPWGPSPTGSEIPIAGSRSPNVRGQSGTS